MSPFGVIVVSILALSTGLTIGFLAKSSAAKSGEEAMDKPVYLERSARLYYAVPVWVSLLVYLLVALIIDSIGFNVWDPEFWRDPDEVGGGAEAVRNFVFAVGALAAIPVGLVTLGNAIRRSVAMDAGAKTGDQRLQTETFSGSIELLGSNTFAQVIGGLYSLERLARETSNQEFLEQIQSAIISYLHAVPISFSQVESDRIKVSVLEVLDRTFSDRTSRKFNFGKSCDFPKYSRFPVGKSGLSLNSNNDHFSVVGKGGAARIDTENGATLMILGCFSSVSINPFDIADQKMNDLDLGSANEVARFESLTASALGAVNIYGKVLSGEISSKSLKEVRFWGGDYYSCEEALAIISSIKVLSNASYTVSAPFDWSSEKKEVFYAAIEEKGLRRHEWFTID